MTCGVGRRVLAIAACGLVAGNAAAQAVRTFSDREAFAQAVGGGAQAVVDFEGAAPGLYTDVNTFGPITALGLPSPTYRIADAPDGDQALQFGGAGNTRVNVGAPGGPLRAFSFTLQGFRTEFGAPVLTDADILVRYNDATFVAEEFRVLDEITPGADDEIFFGLIAPGGAEDDGFGVVYTEPGADGTSPDDLFLDDIALFFAGEVTPEPEPETAAPPSNLGGAGAAATSGALLMKRAAQQRGNALHVCACDVGEAGAAIAAAAEAGIGPMAAAQTVGGEEDLPGRPGGIGVWLQGTGLIGEFDGFGEGQSDGDFDGYAFFGGADYQILPRLYAGVALGYGAIATDLDDGGASDVGTTDIFAYAHYAQLQGLYANGMLGVGFGEADLARPAGAGLTARAETDVTSYIASALVGYDRRVAEFPAFDGEVAIALGPYAGFTYVSSAVDGYTETGAGAANLSVEDEDVDSAIGEIGFRIAAPLEFADAGSVPQLRIGLEHDFANDDRNVAFTPAGGGAARTARVSGGDDTALTVGLSSVGALRENVFFGGAYNGRFIDEGATSHELTATLRITF